MQYRKHKYDSVAALVGLGISYDDATALRRISMTLQRWFELECGNGNGHGSWCVTRGNKRNGEFMHDDDGKPYLEQHHYLHGRGKDYVTYSPLADREAGARKRLGKIMRRYITLAAYVQTDPRGAALYILRPGDVLAGEDISAYYSRGVVVCK